MTINGSVEMIDHIPLICFSIYDKMQGFIHEWAFFLFSRWPRKMAGKRILGKNAFLHLTQKFKMVNENGGK